MPNCEVCGQPIYGDGFCGTGMCGPCTTGEADTVGYESDFDSGDSEIKSGNKIDRMNLAREDFAQALDIVKTSGLGIHLLRHSGVHYSVRGIEDGKRWIVHLYPTNCRVYSPDIGRGIGPGNLHMSGRKWTLVQVVNAIVDNLRKRKK